VEHYIEERLVHPDAAVVLDEAQLRKRFIKPLTLERVAPIISARVCCVISGRSV
jgi:hypothetical protein